MPNKTVIEWLTTTAMTKSNG